MNVFRGIHIKEEKTAHRHQQAATLSAHKQEELLLQHRDNKRKAQAPTNSQTHKKIKPDKHVQPPKKCKKCQSELTIREVRKEGPNKGRFFLACTAPRAACNAWNGWTEPPADIQKSLPKLLTKDALLQHLAVDAEGAQHIVQLPQRSAKWIQARKYRITASNFGTALGHNPYKSPQELVADLVWGQVFTGNKKTRYGTVNEKVAFTQYKAQRMVEMATRPERLQKLEQGAIVDPIKFDVFETGLHVAEEHPWTGCSPDGLVYTTNPDTNGDVTALLEIKCPFDGVPYQFMEAYQNVIVEGIPKGIPPYYYDQIQGTMGLLHLPWADFAVWTPTKLYITRYPFNEEYFQQTLLPGLKQWYFEQFMPVLVQQQKGLTRQQFAENSR